MEVNARAAGHEDLHPYKIDLTAHLAENKVGGIMREQKRLASLQADACSDDNISGDIRADHVQSSFFQGKVTRLELSV